MKKIGVREIFLPGTSTQEIVRWIQENIGRPGKKRRKNP
jgi:methylmalonyl-CoA mutase cobalamin-binding subunit